MAADRCAPAVTRGVVMAAVGFFAFELYTFTDAASTHLFPSKVSVGFPAPYDLYSIGMICMLLAIAASRRLRRLCLSTVAMASGSTLMAISPLYAVLDSAVPACILALLGGVGKAVVFMQVGRMLGLVGPLRLLFIVSGSITLAKGLCLLTAVNGAVFAVTACACALVCALCTVFAVKLLAADAESPSDSQCVSDIEVPGLGMRSMGRKPAVAVIDLTAAEFAALALTVCVFAATCIVCVNPAESLLFERGSLFYGAAGAARFATAAGAAAVVVVMLQFRRGMLLAGRLTAFAMVVGAAGVLIDQTPQTLGYMSALFSQSMFMMLFWITAPMVRCKGALFEDGRLSVFDISAFMYCFGISLTAALSRVGFERTELVLPFAALLIFVILFVMPDQALSSTALTYGSQRDACGTAVRAMARDFGLSGRETEVLELLARGYGSRAIQEKLSISSSTVSMHVQRIYRKTGLHSKQDVINEMEARCNDGS